MITAEIVERNDNEVELFCGNYLCTEGASSRRYCGYVHKITVSRRQWLITPSFKCPDCSCVIIPEPKNNFNSVENKRSPNGPNNISKRFY